MKEALENMMSVVERAAKAVTDTLEIDRDVVERWLVPSWQRPVTINWRVKKLAVEIAEAGVIPGTLHIGELDGRFYRVDGQHRIAAFEMSGTKKALAEVRFRRYATMSEMSIDFDRNNSHLKNMTPDDHLRALEVGSPILQRIRQLCPFVGYGNTRRKSGSPVLSMSATLRWWTFSSVPTPSANCSSIGSANDIVARMTLSDAEALSAFLKVAHRAIGEDLEYQRLWGSLNMVLCMWLYRRTVLSVGNAKSYSRVTRVSEDQFCQCLMQLSKDEDYCEWLVGRGISDRHRAPAYRRIKAAFTRKIESETGKKAFLPAPEWAQGKS